MRGVGVGHRPRLQLGARRLRRPMGALSDVVRIVPMWLTTGPWAASANLTAWSSERGRCTGASASEAFERHLDGAYVERLAPDFELRLQKVASSCGEIELAFRKGRLSVYYRGTALRPTRPGRCRKNRRVSRRTRRRRPRRGAQCGGWRGVRISWPCSEACGFARPIVRLAPCSAL